MKNLKVKIAAVLFSMAGLFAFSFNSVATLPQCDSFPPSQTLCPSGNQVDCCVVLDQQGEIIATFKKRN